MTVNHKAELTVSSVIDSLDDSGLPEGEPEISIFTTDGFIKAREGAVELTYAEKTEGGNVFCRLTVEDGGVLLSRSGAVECNLSFREGETSSTVYKIPPYAFDMSVSTKRVRTTLTEQGGELQLVYLMSIGGQDRQARMKISAKVKK